jgi:hypothetical protein
MNPVTTTDPTTGATTTIGSTTTFDAVLVDQGQEVLFVETDSSVPGVAGSLIKSRNSCVTGDFPVSFGFLTTGANVQPTTAGTGTTTTGGTLGASAYTTLGSVSLNGIGGFTMTQTVVSGGAVQRVSSAGTYSVTPDCSLRLSFAAPASGTTTITPPPFRAILGLNGDGTVLVQPSGLNLTGQFFSE